MACGTTIDVPGGGPIQSIEVGQIELTETNALLSTMTTTGDYVYTTYMCLICGFIYDEAAGWPDDGIAPGTRWEDVPMTWTCPECGATKEDFEMVQI